MENTEIWKPVRGFESRYQVSNHGRVQSFHHGKWKLLNPKRPTTQGYYNIALWDSANGCKGKTICVHVLVADAFCEKPNTTERLEVDHIDTIRLNNKSENLRWLTATQHRRVSYEKGESKIGEEHHNSKLSESQVKEIRSLVGIKSRSKLAAMFSVGQGTIQNVIERKTWVHVL